jgi:perosamine synthetase
MTSIRYPVTEPHLDDSDRSHLLDAFDSGWISSQGPYLEQFERGFAEFVGKGDEPPVLEAERTEQLLASAARFFPPGYLDVRRARVWTCV